MSFFAKNLQFFVKQPSLSPALWKNNLSLKCVRPSGKPSGSALSAKGDSSGTDQKQSDEYDSSGTDQNLSDEYDSGDTDQNLSDGWDNSDTDQKLSDEYDNKSRRNKEVFRESGGPERD